MTKNLNEEYDMNFYPLTDIYENVADSNFLQFVMVANEMYYYLLFNSKSHGFHFVNWRVNYGNLYDFVTEKNKSEAEVKDFIIHYDESAPLLYQRLGLKY